MTAKMQASFFRNNSFRILGKFCETGTSFLTYFYNLIKFYYNLLWYFILLIAITFHKHQRKIIMIDVIIIARYHSLNDGNVRIESPGAPRAAGEAKCKQPALPGKERGRRSTSRVLSRDHSRFCKHESVGDFFVMGNYAMVNVDSFHFK